MLKFIVWSFGIWYLLTILFPGARSATKQKSILESPPGQKSIPAELGLIDDTATVRHMLSIIRSRINPSITVSGAAQIANAVMAASRRFDIDPYLILGVIYAESNAYVWAVNGGSLGLMQVMPKWWDAELRKKGIIKNHKDYFSVEPAVMAGSFILRLCLDRARGDTRKALDYYTGKASSRYAGRVFTIVNLKNGGR